MQCRYCGKRNPASAAVCVACGKPLTTMGPSNATAGPGISRALHRDYPALSHLRYGSRFRTEQYWRTRHLTGFTSSMRPAAMPGGEPARGGPLPGHDRDPRQAAGRAGQCSESREHAARIPSAHEADTPAFEQPMTMTSKQAILRILFMVAVFAIGITVGLSAARWLKRPSPVVPVQAVPHSPPPAAATRSAEGDGRRTAIRGISPSELPYDGAPPPMNEAVPPQAPAASGASGVASYSGASAPEPDPIGTDSAAPPEVPFSGTGSASPDQEKPAIEGASANADAVTAPVPPRTARPAAKSKSGGEATRAKKRADARAAKDREIERIKNQADRELQRKLETSAAEGADAKRRLASRRRGEQRIAASVPGTQAARVRKILAKCERASNLFRREQCKWRVCGDRWGKNGCPSYPKPSSFY